MVFYRKFIKAGLKKQLLHLYYNNHFISFQIESERLRLILHTVARKERTEGKRERTRLRVGLFFHFILFHNVKEWRNPPLCKNFATYASHIESKLTIKMCARAVS